MPMCPRFTRPGKRIQMPVNGLIVRGLLNLYQFYGDDFKVECPTGSGRFMNLYEVAMEISRRLASIFLREENGTAGLRRKEVPGGSKLEGLRFVLRVFPWR